MEYIPVEVKLEELSDNEEEKKFDVSGCAEGDQNEEAEFDAAMEENLEKMTTEQDFEAELDRIAMPRGIPELYTDKLQTRPLPGNTVMNMDLGQTIPKPIANAQGRIECLFCTKTFKSYGIYRLHEKIHTGRGAYHCQTCGKVFGQRSHFVDHVAIHSTIRPFECELCPSRFKEKNTLRRHQQRKHLMFGYVPKNQRGKNLNSSNSNQLEQTKNLLNSIVDKASSMVENKQPEPCIMEPIKIEIKFEPQNEAQIDPPKSSIKVIKLAPLELQKIANAKTINVPTPSKPTEVITMNIKPFKVETDRQILQQIRCKNAITPPKVFEMPALDIKEEPKDDDFVQIKEEPKEVDFIQIKEEPREVIFEEEKRCSSPVFTLEDFLLDS